MIYLFYALISLSLICSTLLAKETIHITKESITISIVNPHSTITNGHVLLYKTIALPEGINPKISAQFNQWKPFAPNEKTPLLHSVPAVRLKQRGNIRGISTAVLEINPIQYDSSLNKYTIADSIIITIQSDKLIPDFSYTIPLKEQGFLSHIINPAHIPACSITHYGKQEKKLTTSWYNPEQEYIRIATKKDGIAYTKAQDILSIKPAWANKSINSFTLFFKGQPYPIAFNDDGDGVLNSNDALLFAARRAEGDTTWRDYVTDEANFYLTVDTSPNPDPKTRLLPMQNISTTFIDSSLSMNMHIEEDTELYAGDVVNSLDYRYLSSNFSVGKNFFWKKLSTIEKYRSFSDTLTLPPALSSVNIAIAMHGANDRPSIDIEHNVSILWNGSIVKIDSFAGFNNHTSMLTIPANDVKPYGNIIEIISKPISDTIITEFYIDYLTVKGTFTSQVIDGALAFSHQTITPIRIPFTKLRTQRYFLIDTLSSRYTIGTASIENNGFSTVIGLDSGYFSGYIADSLACISTALYPVQKSTLLQTDIQADVLLITHPNFIEQAQQLATHRRSQGWNISVITTDDIYKEFSAGRKSAHALKACIQYAYSSWKKPAPGYVLFMGNASWDPLQLTYKSTEIDCIPSYGFPVSDVWYTMLDSDTTDPDLIIGRLSVSTKEQAQNVVEKLIAYDNQSAAPWMKRFLFLSGGDANDPFFYNQFDGVSNVVLEPPISADTLRIRRMNSIGGIDESVANKIRTAINNGTLWVNFAGHGSPQYFELDGWRAQDLQNANRYFMLTTFSCNSGAFAEPTIPCRNESYVLEKNKGAIASIGNTYTGITSPDYFNFVNMYTAFSERGLRRIGDLLFSTKAGLVSNDPFFLNSNMQFNLIGDPLTELSLQAQPDYFIRNEDLRLSTTSIAASDPTFTVHLTVHNRGTVSQASLPIRIIHSVSAIRDTQYVTLSSLQRIDSLSLIIPTYNQSGIHSLDISLDPSLTISEERDRSNNMITIPINVYAAALTSIDPLPAWNIDGNSPRFRFLLPLRNKENTSYDLRIETPLGNTITGYSGNGKGVFTFGDVYADWTPSVSLFPGNVDQEYILYSRTFDPITIQYSPWIATPFYVSGNSILDTASLKTTQLHKLPNNTQMNVHYDSSSNGITLSHEERLLLVEGCNGGENYRYGYFNFGDKTYIERVDASKCNLLHIKAFDTIGVYRDFDGFQAGNEERYRAGNTADLIRYIEDSVSFGDIIAISVSDASFRGALATPIGMKGDKQSFIAAFHSCGSRLIDSIFSAQYYPDGSPYVDEERYRSSFVMIGKKGNAIGTALEQYGAFNDTLSIQTKVTVYNNKGMYSTGQIGPAIEWQSLAINHTLDSQSSIRFALLGRKHSSAIPFILDSNVTGSFNLKAVDALSYPYLEIKAELNRTSTNSIPTLESLIGSYRPAPELIVLPSSFSVVGTEKRDGIALRGDSMQCTLDIFNASLRQHSVPSTPICIVQKPISQGGSSTSSFSELPSIPRDSRSSYSMNASTLYLAQESEWTATIDCGNEIPELHRFNNSLSTTLSIGEDTIPPSIDIYADGRLVNDYDIVSINPVISVRISDNSFLPIDTNKTFIRTNPFSIRTDKQIRNYVFTEGNYGSAVRADFSYIAQDRFDIGENIIYVATEDASANRDTVKRYVRVVLNSAAKDLISFPNPVLSGNTVSLSFEYESQAMNAQYHVQIADIRGSIVHNLHGNATIGKNSISWNGRNSAGVPMPPGIYVYMLSLQGDTYIEPIFGKMIIIE